MNLFKKFIILLLPLAALYFNSVEGEVVKVVLKWKPGFCSASCLQQLERRLAAIDSVDRLYFHASQNQATMRWNPEKSFSFRTIDTTMRSVGVRLHEIFVTVRGTVEERRDTLAIRSLGDGTEFLLLSPITVRAGEAAVEKNIQSHLLEPSMQKKLLQAKAEGRTVTVAGPLFEPERAPPLFIVIQNLSLSKKEDKQEAKEV